MRAVWFIFSMLEMASCARSPLVLQKEQRFLDGFWAGFSSRIIEHSGISASDSQLVFGTKRGTLMSLSAEEGQRQWKSVLWGAVDGQSLIHEERVYVGTSRGRFYSLSGKSGKEIWHRDVAGGISGRPSLAQGLVMFGANDGSLYALDLGSGEPKWKYREPLPDRMTVHTFVRPAPGEKEIYAAFSNGAVVALRTESGEVLWRKVLPVSKRFADILSLDRTPEGHIVVGQFDGKLFLLSAEGQILWTLEQGGSSAWPLVLEDHVLVPMEDSQIARVEVKTGKVLWTYRSPESAHWSGLTVYGDLILCASFEGMLYSLDPKSGQRVWTYDFGSPLWGGPLVVKNRVWVLTGRGQLFGLARRSP